MIRHRFGIGRLGFELETDWERLHGFWSGYTTQFQSNAEPLIRYRATVSGGPVFERLGTRHRELSNRADLFSVLESAFLDDCIGLVSRNFPVYHAASVAFDGVADVYLGASNAGKSTLVANLVKSGGVYLTDEMTCIDNKEVIALPRPIAFNDLDNPPELLPWGDDAFRTDEYRFVDRSEIERTAYFFLPRNAALAGSRFPLGKVFLLRRGHLGPPEKIELQGAELRARLALGRFRVPVRGGADEFLTGELSESENPA